MDMETLSVFQLVAHFLYKSKSQDHKNLKSSDSRISKNPLFLDL